MIPHVVLIYISQLLSGGLQAGFQMLPQSHHWAFLRLSTGLWPTRSRSWQCLVWAQVGHYREGSVQILISYLRERIEAMLRIPSWARVLPVKVSTIPMFDLLLLMLQYLHSHLKMREQAGKESSCAVGRSHSDSAPPNPQLFFFFHLFLLVGG